MKRDYVYAGLAGAGLAGAVAILGIGYETRAKKYIDDASVTPHTEAAQIPGEIKQIDIPGRLVYRTEVLEGDRSSGLEAVVDSAAMSEEEWEASILESEKYAYRLMPRGFVERHLTSLKESFVESTGLSFRNIRERSLDKFLEMFPIDGSNRNVIWDKYPQLEAAFYNHGPNALTIGDVLNAPSEEEFEKIWTSVRNEYARAEQWPILGEYMSNFRMKELNAARTNSGRQAITDYVGPDIIGFIRDHISIEEGSLDEFFMNVELYGDAIIRSVGLKGEIDMMAEGEKKKERKMEWRTANEEAEDFEMAFSKFLTHHYRNVKSRMFEVAGGGIFSFADEVSHQYMLKELEEIKK